MLHDGCAQPPAELAPRVRVRKALVRQDDRARRGQESGAGTTAAAGMTAVRARQWRRHDSGGSTTVAWA
eukprot:350850-Chlamydomonas_euryale.AAC.4